MAFFQFGRKIQIGSDFSLEEIPVFSTLTSAEQKLIRKKSRLVEYKRGDLVYKQGTASEAFYVVLSGRFRIFSESRTKPEGETLVYLYRGEHFGEPSLLTGNAHSASVEATKDGMVLKLNKEDFLKFIQEIPSISLHLNRSLGHRLTKSETLDGRSREVKVCAFYSQKDAEESSIFCFDLCSRLVRETGRRVLCVNFLSENIPFYKEEFKKEMLPDFDLPKHGPKDEQKIRESSVEHPSGFFHIAVTASKLAEAGDKKIAQFITHLTYRYDFVMIRMLDDSSHVASQVLTRCDVVYFLSTPEATLLAADSVVISEFQQRFGFGPSEVKVIVDEDGEGLTFEEKEKILDTKIFSLLPSKTKSSERYHRVIRFLSRECASLLIGLALGSGAAYGLAHIGVKRVFEEENIPVDVIAGSSIGALIGAFWAAGFNSDQLTQIATGLNKTNAFFKLIGFRDLSMAYKGFIKGNQIIRYLSQYFEEKTFQDLEIPLKIVATNIFDSGTVVFEAGPVLQAIRASISIPGIFRPMPYQGEYLIDGGIIDPLPVRILSDMGVKKIIGVNVLTSASVRRKASMIQEQARRLGRASQKKPTVNKQIQTSFEKIKQKYSTNIFNVIMNTIQFMEYELAVMGGQGADVLLHPDFPNSHWAQFYESRKFIRAGEKEAREHLDEIKQLVREG